MDVNSEDKIVNATMWRSFITYLIERSPNIGFASMNISFLLERDIPRSWKVQVEEYPVYIDVGDGGDIQSQWQAFGRHVLAKSRTNTGFALASVKLLTHDRRPIIWPEVSVQKLYPRTMANDLGAEIISKYMLPNHVSI